MDAERTYLHWTGGEGFHVVGHFRGYHKREVEKVKLSLEGLVANLCDDVSVFKEVLAAIYEPYAVLDLSPVMRRGVYRNAFSFHLAAGGVCGPVRPPLLKEFDPERQVSVEWVSGGASRVDMGGAKTFDELVRRYWETESSLPPR